MSAKPVLLVSALTAALAAAGAVSAYDPAPDPRLSPQGGSSATGPQADRNPRSRWFESQAKQRSRSAGDKDYKPARRRTGAY